MYFSCQAGVCKCTKIVQFINLITGKALTWATAVWSQGGEHTNSYDQFLELFQHVFDYSPEGKEIGESLLSLKQFTQSAVG